MRKKEKGMQEGGGEGNDKRKGNRSTAGRGGKRKAARMSRKKRDMRGATGSQETANFENVRQE